MTVKELIEELKNFPEDMEVFTYGDGVGGNEFECEAWEVKNLHHRYVKKCNDINRNYVAQRPCGATAGAKKCLIL